jgi:hypothetical protein
MTAQVIDFMVHLHARRSVGTVQAPVQVAQVAPIVLAPVVAPVRVAQVSAQAAQDQAPSLRAAFYIPQEAQGLLRAASPEGLEIWTWEGFSHTTNRTAIFGVAFAGRAGKALWYRSFRDDAARSKTIQDTIQSHEARIAEKRSRMADRRSFQHELQIGDILYSSWGYDQTNIDFYQVTRLCGKAIGLREISGKLASSDGSGSDKVVADPDNFKGPETKKIPQGFEKTVYVKISDCQTAYKWDGRPLYATSAGWGH